MGHHSLFCLKGPLMTCFDCVPLWSAACIWFTVEIFLFGDFNHGLLRISGLILQHTASAPGTADRCLNSKSKVKVPRDCSICRCSSCGSQHTPGCTALPRHTLRRPALFPLGLALLALLCISLLGQDPCSFQGKTAGVLQFVYLVLAALSQGMGKPRIPFLLWLGGPRSSGQGWSACPRGGDTVAVVHTVHFAQITKLSAGPDAASSKTPGAATGLLVALPLTPSPSGSAAPSDAVVLSGAPPARGCMLHSRSL